MATRGGPPRTRPWTLTHGLLIGIATLAAVGLAFFFGFWGWSSAWHGVSDWSCNDYQPCTADLKLPDGTCTTRRMGNGASCVNSDFCYQTIDTSRVCCDGSCVGNATLCKGYCTIDADCDNFTIPLREFGLESPIINVTTSCIYSSCVTLIQGGQTANCLSWLNTSCTTRAGREASYTAACLYNSYTSLHDICYLSYNCAPLIFPTTAAPTSAPTTGAPTPARKREADEVDEILSKGDDDEKYTELKFGNEPLTPAQTKMMSRRVAMELQSPRGHHQRGHHARAQQNPPRHHSRRP